MISGLSGDNSHEKELSEVLQQQQQLQQLQQQRLLDQQQQQIEQLIQLQVKELLKAQQQLKDLEEQRRLAAAGGNSCSRLPAPTSQPPPSPSSFLISPGSSSLVITASQNPLQPNPTFQVSTLDNVFSNPATVNPGLPIKSDAAVLAAASAELNASGWFHGGLSHTESDALLENTAPGTFLVRASQQPGCFYSLSVKSRTGPTSIRINYLPAATGGRGLFRLDAEELIRNMVNTFPSVVELVEFYLASSYAANRAAHRLQPPILLGKPLYKSPPSLAHQARLAINRSLRMTGGSVDGLQLPIKMKEYLVAYKYTV